MGMEIRTWGGRIGRIPLRGIDPTVFDQYLSGILEMPRGLFVTLLSPEEVKAIKQLFSLSLKEKRLE